MKALLPLISIGLILHAAAQGPAYPSPLPCEKAGKELATFVTRENFTFAGATVLAKYPDGLLLKVGTVAPPTTRPFAAMQDCVVMVPEESLPEAVRKSVGGFTVAGRMTARKQRGAALEAGKEEAFPKAITGNFAVEWYDAADDPFADKPGRAQSWDEYQAANAKQLAEKKDDGEEQERVAPTMVEILAAIEIPGGTEWVWGSGGTLELHDDGSARHTVWKNPGKWEKTADGKLLLRKGRKSFTITFNEKGIGQVVGNDGATTQIYFKARKKPAAKTEPEPKAKDGAEEDEVDAKRALRR